MEQRVLNQKYHIVFKNGKIVPRRPWKGPDVEKFSSSGDPERGIPAMFGNHEERQFLEKLGPFIVVSVEVNSTKGIQQASQILDEGYEVIDEETHIKSKWYVAGYYVRDDGVVYIMTPNQIDDQDYFSRLGLRIDLQNDWGNSFKVGKYLKRLYSHHRKFIQGTVEHQGDGSTILVRLSNGKLISVRYADYGDLTDGMNLVSGHFMKTLGLKQEIGQGLRITALSPKGFSKGHAIVMPDLRHDLVLFNSKKLLFGEQFTFGMDWLHAGALFTDVQSTVNYQQYQHSWLTDWEIVFGNKVISALRTDDELRQMLSFYRIDFHKNVRGADEGEFIEKEKEWSLIRAMRCGVSHKQHPGLYHRFFRLFVDTIAKCENFRIPVPANEGGAKYAIVDPTIFDVNGDPTLDGILKGNQVYCPGHIGPLVFHRQPNAHRGEHHISTAVGSRELESMDAGHFMFLSKDVVASSLGKLGGGDQDDRLVYYTKPEAVKWFSELPPYPVVEFDDPIQVKQSRVNVFINRTIRTPKYNRHQLQIMLGNQKDQGVSIGYAVNAITNDTILTDQKSEILDHMINEMPKTHKVNSALQWLEKKEDYTLRGVASRLEVVIDAVKKTGADLDEIAAELRMYNATFEVVPKFCTTGGKYDGRVPSSRRNETHPVIVRCKMDDLQDELHMIRRDLEDQVVRDSWQMMEPVAMEVITCPWLTGSEHLAAAMRKEWSNQWANLRPELTDNDDKLAGKKIAAAAVKVDLSVYNKFKDNPMVVDAMGHIYMEIYSHRKSEAPLDAKGRPQRFGDGILWGTMLSKLTMKALERAGMAGRYVQANIDKEFRHLKHTTMPVEVYKNLVMNPDTGEVIGGITETVANGMATMEHGFIKVAAPNSAVPTTRMISLSVVNGMETRHASPVELAAWLSHGQAHEKVELVPYIFTNKLNEPEHAVRVMLNGVEYGHITRKDNPNVTRKREGWLSSGRSLKTVTVVTEEE